MKALLLLLGVAVLGVRSQGTAIVQPDVAVDAVTASDSQLQEPQPPPPVPDAESSKSTLPPPSSTPVEARARDGPRHRSKHRSDSKHRAEEHHGPEQLVRLMADADPADTTRDMLLLSSWLFAPLCAVLLLVFVGPLDVFSLMRRGGDIDLLPSKMVPLLKESARRMESWKSGVELTSLRSAGHEQHAKDEPPASEPCAASSAITSSVAASSQACSPQPVQRSVSMPNDRSDRIGDRGTERGTERGTNDRGTSERGLSSTGAASEVVLSIGAPACATPFDTPPPRHKSADVHSLSLADTLGDERFSSRDLLLQRSNSFEEERLSREMLTSASHESRQTMIANERLQMLSDSRTRQQLDLVRVLHLLFPRLARALPLPQPVCANDTGSSSGGSSSGGSSGDVAGVTCHGSSSSGGRVHTATGLATRRARGLPGGLAGPADETRSPAMRRGPSANDLARLSRGASCNQLARLAAAEGGLPVGPRLVGTDGYILDELEDGACCLLGADQREAVASQLPPAHAIRDWTLRYSTEQHGCSLRTMYARLAGAGATVLLVEDLQGARFGGFATERWAPGARYFGTGESFLFRVNATSVGGAQSTPGGGGSGSGAAMTFYKWSGSNSHFQLAYHDSIAMGGGGHFGLWLDEAFEYGSSGRSETYQNAPLGSDESFRVLKVEVWEMRDSLDLSPRLHDYEGLASPRMMMERDFDLAAPHSGACSASEPVVTRAARQGSSAFLMDLLGLKNARRD